MSHHDARFEQFYGEYDDENIGALDDIGDTIGGDATIDQFENVSLAVESYSRLPAVVALVDCV